MNLLTMTGLSKSYTDKILFDNADFSINSGDKVGIIGINGTGKSTLLRVIAGVETPDAGDITKEGQVHIRYLPQNPSFEPGTTIYDYVITKNTNEYNEWTIEGDAKNVLNRLGFTDYDEVVDHLSGGQRKRVALAAALMSDCEILVLDEPTNHLDSDTTEWLEEYLINRKGALVMVTHDRYFLDRVSNRIVEIDKGKLYSYQTNYSGFVQAKLQREEIAQATERKAKSLLKTELEWMARGARARSTKQKAHIARVENLINREKPVEEAKLEISSVHSRMGKTTIELNGISKSFGDNKVIDDFTYIFLRNDRVGFVGKNGCGKSTLMKMLTGNMKPDSGSVTIGETIRIAYFSQENEYMDESLRVIDYINETAENIRTADGLISSTKMLERFLFDTTLQYQKIERLSGGEKRRLYLLKILMEAPNVLVLDEPTNDLDIQTLTVLESYLDSFAGIVIVVSHDRYFLDRIVSRIFAFEGDGKIKQYEGGYSDYLLARPDITVNEKTTKGKGSNQEEEKKKTERVREKKLKMSFNEQREYESIESEIEELETRIEELEAKTLKFASDFVKLAEITREKEECETNLQEKMDRWMYLEDLAERIEAEKR